MLYAAPAQGSSGLKKNQHRRALVAKNAKPVGQPFNVEKWNQEDYAELRHPPASTTKAYELVVYSRDWTLDTIVTQVQEGNIDLDPEFQRRNAWRDSRRSRLIESFILNFPVPQIVLAEDPKRRKSFIIIDGKQRLLTIAGLFLSKYRNYWQAHRFSGLEVLKDLNRVKLDDFLGDKRHRDHVRELRNADIRTSVISGFSDEGVLYDVFYRINTGSVPLSSQELRQVLNRGSFAQYLLKVTANSNPIWSVLGLKGPDPRLRDVELLLRLIAWNLFSPNYRGNMKPFLDMAMQRLNAKWELRQGEVGALVGTVFEAVEGVVAVFEDGAGRKPKGKGWESQVNRALFEVEAFYLQNPTIRRKAQAKKRTLRRGLRELCETDQEFLASIEATTKSIENYTLRFSRYRRMLERIVGSALPPLPLEER
jgi:hypothetical protein